MPHVTRDGVKLYYEEVGAGAPPLVFIHGWCCDRTYFAPQAAHFAARHRCISVDLRGHGLSDKPDQEYSITGFADDLAALCDEIGASASVVVGHSMGGLVALALAARGPAAASAVALLDSPLMPPEGIAGLMAQMATTFRGPGYREAAQGLVANSMFLPESDAALKARIVEAMAGAPQHVLASCWDAIGAFDGAAAAAACRVPALFIDAGGIGDTARFKALCPQLIVEKTVGAGHFHQLEVPGQVNAMLERFLAI